MTGFATASSLQGQAATQRPRSHEPDWHSVGLLHAAPLARGASQRPPTPPSDRQTPEKHPLPMKQG